MQQRWGWVRKRAWFLHTHAHTNAHTTYTQVPQFILDEAISQGRGTDVSIVVTQPRRISALGLAQRVAQERAEQVRHQKTKLFIV